jgi:hypothetical protein
MAMTSTFDHDGSIWWCTYGFAVRTPYGKSELETSPRFVKQNLSRDVKVRVEPDTAATRDVSWFWQGVEWYAADGKPPYVGYVGELPVAIVMGIEEAKETP